jgi:hypothetical protein
MYVLISVMTRGVHAEGSPYWAGSLEECKTQAAKDVFAMVQDHHCSCGGPDMHSGLPMPTTLQLHAWLDDTQCEALDGCLVELDGMCEHGSLSWIRFLGEECASN